MVLKVVLGASTVLQLAVAVAAFRLMKLTGLRAGSLVVVAFFLIGVRNGLVFLQPPVPTPARFVAELLMLAVAALVLAGFARLRPSLLMAQESEERYRILFEQAPIGLGVADLEGNLLVFNEAMLEPGGYSREDISKIGNVGRLYADPADRAATLALAERQGFLQQHEVRFKRKDGSAYDALLSLSRVKIAGREGWQAVVEDISERKRADEANAELRRQLELSQRMEAIGRLAGGIAHDFNNILTAIMSHTELIHIELAASDPKRAELIEIQKSAQRAAQLTRQLLAFSRRQVLQPQIMNLNIVLADAEQLLRRLIGEDIELVTKRQDDLWPIKADPAQIEQVIMNLAVNARDAMPRGGKLAIKTENLELDQDYPTRHDVIRAGAYVVLSVSDAGSGISEEVQAHLFEPFFTTKEVGRGTGLGLATVFGVVKQSDGYISVDSEVGSGTTFKIFLPRSLAEAETAPRHPRTSTDVPAGNETILVVEDEPSVREVVARALRTRGYTVLEAKNASDAIHLLGNNERTPQLVLTDVVMPGMSGRELAEWIRAERPELKVLFMSGYADWRGSEAQALAENAKLLEKPFTVEKLGIRVREVLDS